MKTLEEFKVYYNDNVNEPALLGRSLTLDGAIAIANENVGKTKAVNVDVHGNARTARIEVYQDDMITIVNDEANLNEPIYATDYFYID